MKISVNRFFNNQSNYLEKSICHSFFFAFSLFCVVGEGFPAMEKGGKAAENARGNLISKKV